MPLHWLEGCAGTDLELDFGCVNSFACDKISSAVSSNKVFFFIRCGCSGEAQLRCCSVIFFELGECVPSSFSYLKSRREIRLVVILDALVCQL